MPRWARFLACSLTGFLITLSGVLLSAYTVEPLPHFWSGLQEFITTPDFRLLCWLFALLAALGLLLGRIIANLWGWPGAIAGCLAGGGLALCYIAFLLASQLPAWGGWAAAWPRVWPAAGYIILPFALAGALGSWLWERLE